MDQFLRPDLAYFKAQAGLISQKLTLSPHSQGVAIKDPSAPHGVRLLIEDYPYASDGLEIWDAIKSWVEEYVSFYYKSAEELQKDPELQAWWKELVERDGGDYWTSDTGPLEAFKRFGKNLEEIEKKLIEKNNDETLRNRYGPAKMPYTLLYPSSEEGLTFRGIPNSISI
ncbi:hypothetical protein JHK87_022694 [Glycine soja]|nr:hypothetical protein JHK87_022694 [Glycine soja]